MFNIIKNAKESIDYDEYINYVNNIDWSAFGTLSDFQTESYISPVSKTTTRNCVIKSLSAVIDDCYDLFLKLTVELSGVKQILSFTYKGEVNLESNYDLLEICGSSVTFNELFLDEQNKLIHTFLLDSQYMFSITSDQIIFEKKEQSN